MRKAYGAVDIDTTQHDHALGLAAEKVQQRFGLRSRTDDEIDDYIRSKAADFLAAVSELVAVAANLLNASRRRPGAAVKHSDCVALPDQFGGGKSSDKTISAD